MSSFTDAIERHRNLVRTRLEASAHVRPGPGSVTWKVNREIVVVAAWGRAILMQLAHPSVAAGVHHHSSFRGSLRNSFRRLHSTVGAMLAIAFGNTEDMIAAAARINAIHDRVRGSVEDGGSGHYSAHDPGLQRWVHATLLDSMPRAYEALVAPLTPSERDRYCDESAIMEPLLGMPEGWLPRDATQLDACLRDMLESGELVVTDTSRKLARAVLYPPRWRMMWPAFRAMQLLTIGTLPPSLRDAYGFEWTDHEARSFARWMKSIRAVLGVVPPLARQWPMSRRAADPERRAISGDADTHRASRFGNSRHRRMSPTGTVDVKYDGSHD